jgi:hypothetical protein
MQHVNWDLGTTLYPSAIAFVFLKIGRVLWTNHACGDAQREY